jgi:sugar lactone lactonase YvrE
VGHYAPLDYYPVDVAVDRDYVYSLDLFKEEIQKLDSEGRIIEKFGVIDKWTRDIAVDAAGNTYTVDPSVGKIRKYSPDGTVLLEIGGIGTQPGQFARLLSIVLDEDGNIYVADQATELSAFDSKGELLWNNMASVVADGDLVRPQGIARDSTGNLYVADSARNQIVIFDANGSYLRALGPAGDGWAMQSPVGVSIGADGEIYVLLRLQQEAQIGRDQVLKFSNDGNLLASWGAKGRAPGELWEAQGITLGPDGDVWVAGYMGHNITRFKQDGSLISEWNGHDIKPYEFAQVRGAEVGNNGLLYVTDFWNQSVQVFDRFGQFQFMFGERGQGNSTYFNFPRFTAANAAGELYISDDNEVRRLAADGTFLDKSDTIVRYAGGIEIDNRGDVWVTSSEHDYIRRYTPDLKLLQEFDGTGIPKGLKNPFGLAQGPSGKIYVADTLNHRIIRLSEDGAYELEWGSRGSAAGEFSAPVGLTTDSEGNVYVSETWNKRIQVFSPDGDYLAGWRVPGQPDKDVGRVYELSMDGDYILYAPDHTEGQAEVHKYALAPDLDLSGKPVYSVGQDLGYFLWSDDGSNWHLRWSSDGVQHDFSGIVISTSAFGSSTPFDMESGSGDKLQSVSASRIEFNATEAVGEDGIDFSVNETGVITIYLSIDGVERAELVTVGAGEFSPNTLPVPLKTQYVEVQSIDTVGQPAYVPGQDAGYFLWQGDNGEWNLRWSGDSVTTFNYQGTIKSNSPLTNVREYSFESDDNLVIVSSYELAFNAYAGAGEDGLQFYTSGGAEVTFDLLVNNDLNVTNVYVGSSGESPSTMPFTLLAANPGPPNTDTEAPTVSITEPADGATVAGTVQVLAQAFDNTGIEKVTFGIDGAWAGRDFTPPYTRTELRNFRPSHLTLPEIQPNR